MSELNPLLDVQGLPDARGVDIQHVGISNVEIPMTLVQKDGKTQVVNARAKTTVGLSSAFKGTHMSRFVIQLAEWSRDKVFSLNLEAFLQELAQRLKAESASIDLEFRYFMEKQAPVSKLSAPRAYGCSFSGKLVGDQYQFVLGVTVPVMTLCPCSKAISKYGAHNQRTDIRAKLLLDTTTEHPLVWIEDVVAKLEECSSCGLYPLLKREDEKYVTEKSYENPKFVEDVIRDATIALRNMEGVQGFSLEVESIESIHDHNAWASHAEGFELIS
jgi:GTP cyclohydrolase I